MYDRGDDRHLTLLSSPEGRSWQPCSSSRPHFTDHDPVLQSCSSRGRVPSTVDRIMIGAWTQVGAADLRIRRSAALERPVELRDSNPCPPHCQPDSHKPFMCVDALSSAHSGSNGCGSLPLTAVLRVPVLQFCSTGSGVKADKPQTRWPALLWSGAAGGGEQREVGPALRLGLLAVLRLSFLGCLSGVVSMNGWRAWRRCQVRCGGWRSRAGAALHRLAWWCEGVEVG